LSKSVAKILLFFYCSRWRPPPSWILKFVKFYWLTVSGGPRVTHNHTKFHQNWLFRCRDIAIFRIFKMAATAILDFLYGEILLAVGVHRVESHQRAKFYQNRSIGCEDIKIFRFFKMAAVRHLGFVWGIIGPPTVSTWRSLSLCKIWL